MAEESIKTCMYSRHYKTQEVGRKVLSKRKQSFRDLRGNLRQPNMPVSWRTRHRQWDGKIFNDVLDENYQDRREN